METGDLFECRGHLCYVIKDGSWPLVIPLDTRLPSIKIRKTELKKINPKKRLENLKGKYHITSEIISLTDVFNQQDWNQCTIAGWLCDKDFVDVVKLKIKMLTGKDYIKSTKECIIF